MVPKDSQPLGTTLFQWTFLLLVAGTLATGAFYLYNNSRLNAQSVDTATGDDVVPELPKSRSPNSVAALGRVEPQGEIIRLSAPSALDSVKVEQLLIEAGDWVKKGQVVAVLDGRDRREAALDRAKTEVQVAKARLGRVRAGNSDGDINAQRSAVAAQRSTVAAQQAAIARFEAELKNAQIEFDRNQKLYTEGAVSKSVLDAKELTRDVAQRQLSQAESTLAQTESTLAQAQNQLESVSEVRPEDVNISTAEVASAQAAVKQAEADLDQLYIRASSDGQVLKVHVRPGEVVGQQGIAEIAQTSQMNVIAQVYETDIKKVKLGQRATVTSTSLDNQELRGQIVDISRQVIRQSVFENNPFADTGNRIIEVKIRLDPPSSNRVSSLSNMQVQVVIHTKS